MLQNFLEFVGLSKPKKQEINLIEDLKEFRDNQNLLDQVVDNVQNNIFKFTKPYEGSVHCFNKFPYLSLTVLNLGQFSDYYSFKFEIKNITEDILFHFYKKYPKRCLTSDLDLRIIIQDVINLLFAISKNGNKFLKEHNNTGIYIPYNEKIVDFIYAKVKKDIIIDTNNNIFNNFCMAVPEYLLHKNDYDVFMAVEVKDTIKNQIINNNFAPLIEHFKIG